jgi:lipid-A-disaccharide synthase
MRVFLSAGEASGDAYGAALVREMRRLGCESEFSGIGGPRMRDQNVGLVADSSRWGAISITQSLKVYPRVVRSYYRAKRALASGQPGLFVPIDFGYANIRLARHAKNHGWKVLYFVPPSSWRKDRQGSDLPAITDAISTPFPWSAEILNGMGANAHWFGHPIKQLLRSANPTGLTGDGDRRTLAVLPGSRSAEIEENLPVIAQAVGEQRIEFALAPSTDPRKFEYSWNRLAPGRTDSCTVGDTYGVLLRARAAIVCSGTATLEAALCRCPMVVVYRVSKAVQFEAKLVRFKRPKYIALPNILLDREVVPELLQDDATPQSLAEHLARILEGLERERQIESFDELDRLLGPNDAITRTAELALSMVRQGSLLSQ